jgi:hypothetical protein
MQTKLDMNTLVDVSTETRLSSPIFAKNATAFVFIVKLSAKDERAQKQ